MDVADGFYRIYLVMDNIPSLAFTALTVHQHTLLITFLLVLPMDSTESPPYFTLVMETITDLTNHCLQIGTNASSLAISRYSASHQAISYHTPA
jgi:hypothetical protein